MNKNRQKIKEAIETHEKNKKEYCKNYKKEYGEPPKEITLIFLPEKEAKEEWETLKVRYERTGELSKDDLDLLRDLVLDHGSGSNEFNEYIEKNPKFIESTQLASKKYRYTE